jgi:hypothetical protein
VGIEIGCKPKTQIMFCLTHILGHTSPDYG